ncbi:hypothetical protein H4582DRAFT_1930769 [Lactarius indigo]|nr:hypothetical protein H4582DRAFT_1930769 [Lactarius indigo]
MRRTAGERETFTRERQSARSRRETGEQIFSHEILVIPWQLPQCCVCCWNLRTGSILTPLGSRADILRETMAPCSCDGPRGTIKLGVRLVLRKVAKKRRSWQIALKEGLRTNPCLTPLSESALTVRLIPSGLRELFIRLRRISFARTQSSASQGLDLRMTFTIGSSMRITESCSKRDGGRLGWVSKVNER